MQQDGLQRERKLRGLVAERHVTVNLERRCCHRYQLCERPNAAANLSPSVNS